MRTTKEEADQMRKLAEERMMELAESDMLPLLFFLISLPIILLQILFLSLERWWNPTSIRPLRGRENTWWEDCPLLHSGGPEEDPE